MKEKILDSKKNGLLVLFVTILLYLGAIALIIIGGIMLDDKNNAGIPLLAIGV